MNPSRHFKKINRSVIMMSVFAQSSMRLVYGLEYNLQGVKYNSHGVKIILSTA